MLIQCLRNLDLVAICCEIEDGELAAQWVQINPKTIATILGTEQELVQPKTQDGITLTVMVPLDIAEVYTDVHFPIVAMAGWPKSTDTTGDSDRPSQ